MSPATITKLSAATKLSLLAIVILVGAIFFTVNSALEQQTAAGHAWYTTQSAKAVCANLGTTVDVSFTNTETSNYYAMNVVAQDVTTGQTVDLGTINAQATKTGIIKTTRSLWIRSFTILVISRIGMPVASKLFLSVLYATK